MYLINAIEKGIDEQLLAENKTERENHVSSGKLSASNLGSPLQWQILSALRIPQPEFDPYTLRKFQRGKDVEAWLMKRLGCNPDDKQNFVEYKDAIGYLDCMVDSDYWDFKFGWIPMEVKSVSNAKYKRIVKQRAPDRSHLLQAAFYALALGKAQFALTYIATDDYRTLTWAFDTAQYAEEIDGIIEKYQAQLKLGTIPVFEAVEKWQESAKYNRYPEWSALDHDALQEKFKAMPR